MVNKMNDWVLVVDDDIFNLKMAGHLLGTKNMRVSCLESGEDTIEFLRDNRPDIILLDIHMPGMDGFDTMAAIRQIDGAADIPVIFLTADDDGESEARGLAAGAMDFIKKPFVPEVLLLRVRHTIDLVHLQTNLAREVEKKTQEVMEQNGRLERIFMQIVKALSDAIDAKDTYTKGHSARVAEYSREIARRAGFSRTEQSNIYVMGLLHDVGKIGIPDAIINKKSRLTDEEYAIIKTHSSMGAEILGNITEFPQLTAGARWHHERYDGRGYPDGISGEDIPVQARMIAVADAYDAMSSRRSYQDVVPQAQIRDEIQKNAGKQFDPAYAKIMLEMIDEDTEYRMRER